ncbi:MAG: CDP-alcohol phosphatidyltransferase family protein [Methanomicrobiales archaeon]
MSKSFIPSIITSVRIIIAPIFFISFLNQQFFLSLTVLIIAGLSDILDGYIARQMDSTSNEGAYLDVIADFIFITACISAFVVKGWYNPLIILLIIAMFTLFISTSNLEKPVYDPFGKYLGGFLFLMIYLTFLFPEMIIREIMLILLILISIFSVFFRLKYIHEN